MPNDFLEKTLEDIIFENKDIIHLRGLCPFKKVAFRQVVLPSGKRIDILGFDLNNGHISLDIYELKRDFISIEAICQAYNYLEEIKCLIKGSFKSWDASIIMVGKRYDQISILDSMNIPVHVYTYDYQFNGIKFNKKKHNNVVSYTANEKFSLGLWAWGLDMLCLTGGSPSSMSFHTSIERHLIGDFETTLKNAKHIHTQEVKLLPPIDKIKPGGVTTVVFPEQPAWSTDFAKGIPYSDDILEDTEQDNSDFEIEYPEHDDTDLEPDNDLEPDYYNVPEDYSMFSLRSLDLPPFYYVKQ